MGKKKSEPKSPRQKLEDKVAEACGSEIVETINSAKPEELKSKLVALDMHEKETEDAKAEDEQILDLKAELSQAEGPYKDTLKGIKLQRRFIVLRLEEQGKA